jgi:hypothetical protein
MADTRTPAEIKYDAERNGTLYTPEAAAELLMADEPPVTEPKQTKARLLAFLDGIPDQHKDMAMLGLELVCYAHGDRPIPDRLHSAVMADQYERARAYAMAQDAAQPTPAPEERYPDITIGTIDGCAVIGHYSDETPYELYCASITWNGLHFSTDGTDYINLDLGNALEGGVGLAAENLQELGGCGDMHLHEWGKVKELAQSDVMEQLIALAKSKAQRAV